MDPETLRRGLEWFNFIVTIGMISLFGLFLSLAYIGEGQKWARALVYMGLLAGLALLVAFGLPLALVDLAPILGEILAGGGAAPPPGPGAPEGDVARLPLPGVDAAGLAAILPRVGWVMLVLALLGLLLLLPPLRRLIARLIPIDAGRLVHTVALQYSLYLVLVAVLTLIVVSTALRGGGPEGLALEDLGATVTLSGLWAQAIGFAVVAFLGVGWLVQRDGRATLERLGLEPRVDLRWLVAVVLVGLGAGYLTDQLWRLLDPDSMAEVERLSEALFGPILGTGLAGALTIGLSAGIGEELLFRGAAQPRLGLVFTALLFAVIHTQYTVSPALIQVFLLGILLGLARIRANTSTAIAAHAGYNFILALLAIYAPELAP